MTQATTRHSTLNPSPPPYWACLLTFQEGAPNASRGLHDTTSLMLPDRACAGRWQEGCACASRAPGDRRDRLGVCVCAQGLPSLRAPGPATYDSQDLITPRAARKLSRRSGWSTPAAAAPRRLQGSGQRRGRLSRQGPRVLVTQRSVTGEGDPPVGPVSSPAPWSASPAAAASAGALGLQTARR